MSCTYTDNQIVEQWLEEGDENARRELQFRTARTGHFPN
jgi:hypothetical protein